MEINPYVSPAAELHAQAKASNSASEVHDTLIELLTRTKPWLRVVGVFMWIGVGLMLLGGLIVLVVGAVGPAFVTKANPAWNGAMMMGMALIYIVLAALYIYPARRIWSCGSAIARLAQSRSLSDLQSVLEAQRSFWTFVGVGCLLIAGIYALILLGAVVVGVMSAGAPHAP